VRDQRKGEKGSKGGACTKQLSEAVGPEREKVWPTEGDGGKESEKRLQTSGQRKAVNQGGSCKKGENVGGGIYRSENLA